MTVNSLQDFFMQPVINLWNSLPQGPCGWLPVFKGDLTHEWTSKRLLLAFLSLVSRTFKVRGRLALKPFAWEQPWEIELL